MAACLLALLLGLRVCKVTLNSEFCEPYSLWEHRICSLFWYVCKPDIECTPNIQASPQPPSCKILKLRDWISEQHNLGVSAVTPGRQLPPLDPPCAWELGVGGMQHRRLSLHPVLSGLLWAGDLPGKGCQGKVSCCADIPWWGIVFVLFRFLLPVWWKWNAILTRMMLIRQLYLGATQRLSLVKDLLLLALMVKILISVIYFGMEKLVLQRCGRNQNLLQVSLPRAAGVAGLELQCHPGELCKITTRAFHKWELHL